MEAELSWNLRVSAVRVEPDFLHTLTRESQEVMVGLIVAKILPIDVVVLDP